MDEWKRLLWELASRRGITDTYHDVLNMEHVTTDDQRVALLNACGHRTDTVEALRAEIDLMENAPWTRLIDPVFVKLQSEIPGGIRIQTPAVPDRVELRLVPDRGGEMQAVIETAGLLQVGERQIGSHTYRRFAVPLPWPLEIGYYTLFVRTESGEAICSQQTRLIICPERAHLPEWYEKGERMAGIGVSLYGLRSGRNLGVGDLQDLRGLVDWAADAAGVDFIGLNPLHAIFNRQPYNASPYLASSRFYRNFLYLSLDDIDDFRNSQKAQELLASPRVQEKLTVLRGSDTVCYEDAAALKLELLAPAFEQFVREGTARDEFERYVSDEGEHLDHFAAFCAIEEDVKRATPEVWSWMDWPDPLRDPRGDGVREFKRTHADRILFFKYLQWHLDRQLAVAAARAREKGMRVGLYLDQALAIDRHGADFWAYRGIFVEDAKSGAPPDPLATQGQDWQFPPPDREKYRADAYRLFSEKIRRNCRHAGALRLDHVMRLLRLFWIPAGKTSVDGVYVLDYHDDLLRIVCLESVLNRTIIIGEDLGTVPDWIREILSKHGILSYRVFHFERTGDGAFKSPHDYPRLALATLSTHDLPTLCGFWEETDITRRRQAGVIRTDEDERRAREDRAREKARIAQTLNLPLDAPVSSVRDGVAEFLAKTPSALMLLNQEDLFFEREQQNMPGTTAEHLNWARKMLHPVEALGSEESAAEAGRALRQILEKTGRAR